MGRINTPGAGGPTPDGTAGGQKVYFFFLALALGFAAAFFFGAAFFLVGNALTSFRDQGGPSNGVLPLTPPA